MKVYKVIKQNETFVFLKINCDSKNVLERICKDDRYKLSKNDIEELKKDFGEKYNDVLMLKKKNTLHIFQSIQPDDNILTVKKKISQYCAQNNSIEYLNVYSYEHSNEAMVEELVRNVFRNMKKHVIDSSHFANMVKVLFNMEIKKTTQVVSLYEALAIVQGNVKFVPVNLGYNYKYFDGKHYPFPVKVIDDADEELQNHINETPKIAQLHNKELRLLNSFDLINDELFVEEFNENHKIYFPYHKNASSSKSYDIHDDLIFKIDNTTSLPGPSFLTGLEFSLTPIQETFVDLDQAFKSFNLSIDIPFFKYVASNHIPVMKYAREMFCNRKKNKSSESKMLSWSDIQPKKAGQNCLIATLQVFNDEFATMFLNDDGKMSITVNLNETLQVNPDHVVNVLLKNCNMFLETLNNDQNLQIPLLKKEMFYQDFMNNSSLRMSISSRYTSQPNTEHIMTTASNMTPVFTTTITNKQNKLVYKRVNLMLNTSEDLQELERLSPFALNKEHVLLEFRVENNTSYKLLYNNVRSLDQMKHIHEYVKLLFQFTLSNEFQSNKLTKKKTRVQNSSNSNTDDEFSSYLKTRHSNSNTNSNSNTFSGGNTLTSYTLKRLEKADPDLFNLKTQNGTNEKGYAQLCQQASARQPIAITGEQKDHYDKMMKEGKFGDYGEFALKYSSNAQTIKNNYYICPAVWCEKSEIPLSLEQYKINGCPEKNEKAIEFGNKPYWLDKKTLKYRPRMIQFNDDTQAHPQNKCLPCCGLKNPSNKAVTMSKCIQEREHGLYTRDGNLVTFENTEQNNAYIISKFPAEEDRYGLLPKSVLKLFNVDKQICGKHENNEGLMNKQTKCFLHKGIGVDLRQPYLSCMVKVLGNTRIKSVQLLKESITKNLSVMTFLSLNKGAIFRYFVDRDINLLSNPGILKELKEWMHKNSIGKKYVDDFKLSGLAKSLFAMKTLTLEDEEPTYVHVLREIYIYNAYKNFIAYINDDNLVKDHFILNDLFNRQLCWLNTHGYNIEVFELKDDKVHYDCTKYQTIPNISRKYKPYVFLLNKSSHYEPIVYCTYNIRTKEVLLHNYKSPVINKLMKSLECECKHDIILDHILVRKAIESVGLYIYAFVLTYSFELEGFLISEGVTHEKMYIPLNKREVFIPDDNVHVVFTSSISSELPPKASTFDNKKLEKIATSINQTLSREYITIRKPYVTKDSNKPLITEIGNGKEIFDSFNFDLSLFTSYEFEDERKKMIRKYETKDKLYTLFRNEMVSHLIENSHIIQDVISLRHQISNQGKTNHLAQKLANVVKKLNVVTKYQPSYIAYIEKRRRRISNAQCSKQSLDSCKEHVHCSQIKVCENKQEKDKCALTLTGKEYELFLIKFIDELLTSSNVLDLRFGKIKGTVKNKDYIFTNDEIKQGKLQELIKSSPISDSHYEVRNLQGCPTQAKNKIEFPDFMNDTKYKVHGIKTMLQKDEMFKNLDLVEAVPETAQSIDDFLFLLEKVYNHIQKNSVMKYGTLKTLLFKHLRAKSRNIDLFRSTYVHHQTEKERMEMTPHNIKEFFSDPRNHYKLADIDLNILAEVIGINIIKIKRLNKNDTNTNTDTDKQQHFNCLGKNPRSNTFIVINERKNSSFKQNKSKFNEHDYNICVKKNTNQFVFTTDDIPCNQKARFLNNCTSHRVFI